MKDMLWQAIGDSLAPDVVISLTSTMNERLRNVFPKGESYIHPYKLKTLNLSYFFGLNMFAQVKFVVRI